MRRGAVESLVWAVSEIHVRIHVRDERKEKEGGEMVSGLLVVSSAAVAADWLTSSAQLHLRSLPNPNARRGFVHSAGN